MIRLFLFSLFLLNCQCGSQFKLVEKGGPAKIQELFFSTDSSKKELFTKIIIIDVGQGDATLLVSAEKRGILIDCGPKESAAKIRDVLEKEGLKKLEAIFISHYHGDHINGCLPMLRGPDGIWDTVDDIELLEGFYDRGEDPFPQTYSYREYRNNFLGRRNAVAAGENFEWNKLKIKVFSANAILDSGENLQDELTEENALSLALVIDYGGVHYFTAGDLTGGGGGPKFPTTDIESALANLVGEVELLHVSHHGSHTSSNDYFLEVLKPKVAFLSLGNENEFYHPHPSLVNRLLEKQIKVYSTEQGSLSKETEVKIMDGSIQVTINQNGEVKISRFEPASQSK